MERASYWFKEIGEPPASPTPAATEAEPERTQADVDAEVDLYAVTYPDRSARIRAASGLPARRDFGPPEPEIIASLLRRTLPAQAA